MLTNLYIGKYQDDSKDII